MVQMASSPSSPVTIKVSSSRGKGGGFRGMGLTTSPIPRFLLSNNQNSPLSSRENRASSGGGRRASSGGTGKYCSISKDEAEEVSTEFVNYTVHIPPTPDHQPMNSSQSSLPDEDATDPGKPNRSYISSTIFTGGFNSVTRGHVIDQVVCYALSRMICGNDGTEEKGGDAGCRSSLFHPLGNSTTAPANTIYNV